MYELNQEYYELKMWVLQGQRHTNSRCKDLRNMSLHFLKITE
jgi:hypothetical protein